MSDTSGTPSPSGDEHVGHALARLRRTRNLTGAQLGNLVGMSQPKISRLERGLGAPDPDDVARIARALDADEDQVRRLVELAEDSLRVADWHPISASLVSRQRDIGQRESEARVFRYFQPTVISAPLQTSEYARALLSTFQALMSPNLDVSTTPAVPEAVSARVRRQENLADRNRTFHFVMAETVLNNRIGSPQEMPAQIRRVREVAQQENVTVAIIPAHTQWQVPPLHGFLLLDDHAVAVDLYDNGLMSRSRRNAQFYRQVFESFERLAIIEIDEILDKYLDLYLDLSRPQRRNRRSTPTGRRPDGRSDS